MNERRRVEVTDDRWMQNLLAEANQHTVVCVASSSLKHDGDGFALMSSCCLFDYNEPPVFRNTHGWGEDPIPPQRSRLNSSQRHRLRLGDIF